MNRTTYIMRRRFPSELDIRDNPDMLQYKNRDSMEERDIDYYVVVKLYDEIDRQWNEM